MTSPLLSRVASPRSALGAWCAAVVVGAAALVASPQAAAAPNDITLLGLVDTSGATPVADQEAFKLLVRDLGLVVTPTNLQLAETTGQAGFEFGVDYTFHTLRLDESYWQNARESAAAPFLMTLGARARKGFILPVPLASELEVGANWIVDSSLVSMGANLRVALNEGFRWIPDVAVNMGVNNLVGEEDLFLLTWTMGASVSKGFGVVGSFNIAPFLGYQSIFSTGSSRLLDTNPLDTSNVEDNVVFNVVPLLDGENRVDRISGGLRFVIAHVMLIGGVDVNLVGGVPVMQYGLRAGVSL